MYPNEEHEIGSKNAKWIMAKENYAPIAEFYANYFKYFFGTGGTNGQPKPTYVEVMNEPFVKATSIGTTRADISEMFRVVAKRIKELNPEIKVGGYSAAHPAYEAVDFGHWDKNWKTFIDIAGEEMDFFSLHLYDNVQKVPEEGQYRAGSNIEAILDMVEHYEILKLGKIKPFCLSEYGCLNTEGEVYTKERDWNNIRSFNTMIMQFLERPDVIEQALPFMILKANWWNHPTDPDIKYAHRLFRQKKELAGETGEEWVYTELIKFYDFWKNVKGTRIDTKASNLDTQVDTYVDGNKAYVIVNNMHHQARTVDLNLKGLGDATIQSILVKHLHAENNGIPTLDEYTVNNINSVNIGREASIILEYTFDKNVVIPEVSNETKYYATTYNQKINSNQTLNFHINNVNVNSSYGEATLRLGIGRAHGKSLKPLLKVNGNDVLVPDNWRGNDQSGRDQFFGVLEIPVPYTILSQNNTIAVTFPDAGGNVSSVALQVQSFDKEIIRSIEKGTTVGNDNFSIRAIGKTCEGSNNGILEITATKELNYLATLKETSSSKKFTQNTSFENLASGSYELTITSSELDSFEQKFIINIPQANKLNVASNINTSQKTVTYYLSGAERYTVNLNNQLFATSDSSIQLAVNNGKNSVEISTNKACQEPYIHQFYYENNIQISPNPFTDSIEINLGKDASKTAEITINSIAGALTHHSTQNISNNILTIHTHHLAKGVYVLSVKTDETLKNMKIYKK
ncbi:T9SS type A sorting domain-containing protein [Wenyingzhuangia sp. 1_MG-2023]|nr:T9SS type A sorting domain-containing protein [Wenyingzhuangia sp. 1_MG-2023]